MINLNNRLAVYVEKVRSLETENSRLHVEISSYEESRSMEVSVIVIWLTGFGSGCFFGSWLN